MLLVGTAGTGCWPGLHSHKMKLYFAWKHFPNCFRASWWSSFITSVSHPVCTSFHPTTLCSAVEKAAPDSWTKSMKKKLMKFQSWARNWRPPTALLLLGCWISRGGRKGQEGGRVTVSKWSGRRPILQRDRMPFDSALCGTAVVAAADRPRWTDKDKRIIFAFPELIVRRKALVLILNEVSQSRIQRINSSRFRLIKGIHFAKCLF